MASRRHFYNKALQKILLSYKKAHLKYITVKMKLFFAFTALAAASTTPQPTTGQSTAAGQSTPSASYSCAEHVDNIAEAVMWAQMGLAMTDAEVQQKTDDCEAACELEGADVTQCADAFESSGSFYSSSSSSSGSSSSESSSSGSSSSGSSNSTVTVSQQCLEAQAALDATENSIDRLAKLTECEVACADDEGEECGFLVNGLSFVLLAILAIFKY